MKDIFRRTRAAFPDADVFASTLDDFTNALLDASARLDLPVVTSEIGDTWAYGIASDADKVAEFRALLRMRTATEWKVEEVAYRNFSRLLLKVNYARPATLTPDHNPVTYLLWGRPGKEAIVTAAILWVACYLLYTYCMQQRVWTDFRVCPLHGKLCALQRLQQITIMSAVALPSASH